MTNKLSTSYEATPHQFPTGQRAGEYEGWEKWGDIKWAWEFLKRNNEYQECCVKCERNSTSIRKRNAIARKEFGLLQFKDYREPFEGNEVVSPRFVTTNIQYWPQITEKQQQKCRDRNLKLVVRPGEVVFKFDLRAVEKTSKTIDGQLCAARTLLTKLTDQWLALVKKTTKRRPRKRLAGREALELLRLLDLIAFNDARPTRDRLSNATLYEILYPRLAKSLPGQKRDVDVHQQSFERRRQKALKYSKRRYLDLAALGVKKTK